MSKLTLKLLKAIWSSGFRAGRDAGYEFGRCEEWGALPGVTQDPKKAWQEQIQWRLEPDCVNNRLDREIPEAWDNIIP